VQVLALAQHFSKLYWKDEVRSSGKNAVFELKMRRLGNPKYSRHFQKSPHYWEILSLFIDGEMQAAVSLAEGEELGSNLLR